MGGGSCPPGGHGWGFIFHYGFGIHLKEGPTIEHNARLLVNKIKGKSFMSLLVEERK